MRVALSLSAILWVSATLSATTFVMVSDADLVDQATLIAVGRVLAASPAVASPDEPPLPSTDYRIEIERLLKGAAVLAPSSTASLTMRVAGGVGADGIGLRVWGAPQLSDGERAIFFLVPDAGGTFHPLHLMLGVFRELAGPEDRPLALRDLSEAAQLKQWPDGAGLEAGPLDPPRDFERFADWIETVAGSGSAVSPPDYFVDVEAAELKFTLIAGDDNFPIRWFNFDTGGSIGWQANSGGQTGLAGGGFNEFQAAIAVWNNDPTTPIRYLYQTTTTASTTTCQAINGFGRLVFNDPNAVISDPYSCSTGGVLAFGGPCYFLSLQSYRGSQYHPAAGAFIVTNDNTGCFFQTNTQASLAAGELFAHELGHTLGLGHSQNTSALMFANLHNDGRGASLTADDRDGINEIYGSGSPPPPPKPAAPSALAAVALSDTQVSLSWSDNANNESGFRLERRQSGGSFQQVAAPGANSTTVTVGGHSAATTYDFRIRATNGGGNSDYSNVATATTEPPGGLPATPSGLTAQVLSSTAVHLSWNDNAGNETGFQVERKQYDGFAVVAAPGANTAQVTVSGLDSAAPYQFRVRAINGNGASGYSNVAAVETPGVVGPCVVGDTTLCLQDGAVRVQVNWRNQRNGELGVGRAVAGTDKSGYFWFFNAQNIELVVKALDAQSVNGFYWFFYGALSDVEYWVRVTQTDTGEVAIYRNAPGNICGVGDTAALAANATQAAPALQAAVLELPALAPGSLQRATGSVLAALPATSGSCVPGSDRLCLLGSRFEVTVDWINQHAGGTTGIGHAIPGGDKSGFFWFFNDKNVELVVKALDGRPVNGKLWLFYGALSNVEYTIRVRDTVTGAMKTYRNPPGEICGFGDDQAFDP